jgi:peptide/nickel transport system substrate-binding protein
MASALQLRVFLAGRVAVEADGVVIDERRFPGRQGRLVFAYLVCEQGRPVPRDELAEVIWSRGPPPTWDNALTVIASKLRALLTDSGVDGASALTGAFGCYRLELPEGTWVDVVAARRAASAAAEAFVSSDLKGAKGEAALAASLLERPFLPGEEGAWAEESRRDLAGVRVGALNVLAEVCLRLGETSEAVKWSEEEIALEPFRETGYRRLMDAHTAAGNRAEALRVYERCRRLLAEELGTYPSPETEAVYRALLEAPPEEAAAVGAEFTEAEVLGAAAPKGGGRRSVLPVAATVIGVVAVVAVALGLLRLGSHAPEGSAVAVDADSVGVFNAGDGRAVAEARVGTGPHGVASGARAVWVTNTDDNSVSRIDPKSNAVVQTIPVGQAPEGIVVGGGFVWVANSLARSISKLDPTTDGVVQTIPVGNEPSGIAYGLGGVWVTNVGDRTLIRIDPATGATQASVTIDAGTDGVAVGDGSVWVTSGSSAGSVARVDPKTLAVTTIGVGAEPSAIAVGPTAVWVVNSEDGTVSSIDPNMNRQTGAIRVGAGADGLALSHGRVWVSNEQGGTLSEIDPSKGRVVHTAETDNRPLGIAAKGGSLYVAVRTYGRAHRGGTLVLLSKPLYWMSRIDPADSYNPPEDQILLITNDGLVAFKRAGGSDGIRLVPDLATSLPTPADGGRTYTFQLRHGIRFSNGRPVDPADVRRSIERALADREGPGAIFFSGIVGADACTAERCNLAAGIVTSAAANTVTFHLTAPDQDFLYKLAQTSAMVVPADTPLDAPSRRPLPATGPYMFAEYDVNKRIRLVRNPYFHEWSAAAQPDGFPNEIAWKIDGSRRATVERVRAVERGEADVAYSGVPSSLLREVLTRFASQAHVYQAFETDYFSFDTRVRPFNDVRVRLAVNLALDRTRLAALQSPPGRPTCQLLPPGMFGYRRYCPYTRDPRPNGRYGGPNLARAKKLVAASGTAGETVTVWATPDPPHPAYIAYVGHILRLLGYRARLELIPGARLFPRVGDPRFHFQLVLNGGWLPDYQSPYDYFGVVDSCATVNAPNKNNWSFFCNRRIEAEMRRAHLLEATDPQRAARLWERVERNVADQAPMVTYSNERGIDFVSRRVGNYQYNPQWGALLVQLWVK